MAPSSSHPTLVGHSVHGLDRQTVLQLHQQALERTIQSSLTLIDDSDQKPHKRNFHNKKKKKYYPWIQRDSLARRERIGNPDKFVDHPCAVLYHVDLAFPGYGHDAPSFHWKYDAVMDALLTRSSSSQQHLHRSLGDAGDQDSWERALAQRRERERQMAGHHRLTRAQRKDIKKVHVPQGIVKRYEGELVDFLDQLSLASAHDTSSSVATTVDSATTSITTSATATITATATTTTTTEIMEDKAEKHEDGEREPSRAESVNNVGETQPSQTAAANTTNKTCSPSTPTLTGTTPSTEQHSTSRVYLRWEIQDRFLRFVAHALCSFYGMVSFTKTCKEGKQWMYVCHPEHLDSLSKATTVSLLPDNGTPSSTTKKSQRTAATNDEEDDQLMSVLSKLSLSGTSSSSSSSKRSGTGHQQLKSLDRIETMPLSELDRLWPTIAGCKVKSCLARPETTFFEYLFPASRLNI
ncbi:hypothetical protein BGW41_000525 [Actinomortierella wolfii]|nr:hypothetical protein BGW41_000525 [Actinomortierella wolfii]